MRAAVLLLALASLAGCDRPAEQKMQTPNLQAKAPAPVEASADWPRERALPAPKGDPFGGRHVQAPPRRAAQDTQDQQPVAPTAAPPPYKYVGKMARGREQGRAVLAREDRVFMVRAGDTLETGYGVQSVTDTQVVLVDLASGAAHVLPYVAGVVAGAINSPVTGAGPALDDVSLMVHGPTSVGVGEQFTFTVSLDSGFKSTLETGRVEVRFDPKVLAIQGEPSSSGTKRLDISGAYAGHPAPAVVQFRVIALAPTATEIRVVPTQIADSDGRDVGVNTPQAHRLTIVRSKNPGSGS